MNPLMMNPNLTLMNMLPQNSPLFSVLSANNPQQAMEQMLSGNPQMQQMLQQARAMTNMQNPKDIAMALARKNGMPEQQVMSMFNSIKK